MNKILHLLIMLAAAGTVLAQGYDAPVRSLSEEEVRLVQAYRKNPEPFRHLLYGQEVVVEHREHPSAPRVLGPRDVIDVGIEGGSVAFYGNNYAYDPVSFRIVRGEEKEVVFRRQRSSFETRVIVSYRSDGLHFDVPHDMGGPSGSERGLLVLGEEPRWNRGDAIESGEKLNARRSVSKADHVIFHIRYASSRP
jgi:hypothetical protein